MSISSVGSGDHGASAAQSGAVADGSTNDPARLFPEFSYGGSGSGGLDDKLVEWFGGEHGGTDSESGTSSSCGSIGSFESCVTFDDFDDFDGDLDDKGKTVLFQAGTMRGKPEGRGKPEDAAVDAGASASAAATQSTLSAEDSKRVTVHFAKDLLEIKVIGTRKTTPRAVGDIANAAIDRWQAQWAKKIFGKESRHRTFTYERTEDQGTTTLRITPTLAEESFTDAHQRGEFRKMDTVTMFKGPDKLLGVIARARHS